MARESLRAEARGTGKTVYQVRLERAQAEAVATGQPLPTAREAVGHRQPGQRAPQANITAYLADPARASVVSVDIPTARRIGKHDELARVLAEGGEYRGKPLTPGRFRRLVAGWAPSPSRGARRNPASTGS